MLTPEERFWIGIEVLERVRPRLKARRRAAGRQEAGGHEAGPQEASRLANSGEEAAPGWEEGAYPDELQNAPPTEDQPIPAPRQVPDAVPCLQGVVAESGGFAPQTVVLGLCEDRMPFTLDLNDPAPGALLVVGDQGSGKAELLRSILASTVCLNRPGEVIFQVVSPALENFDSLSQAGHCSQAASPADLAARELVLNLASLVEQRRRGSLRGPAVLLAVDDLAEWAQYMDDEEFASLLSIIRHGPRLRIWTIATLATERAGEVSERLVAAFRTRILGSIQDVETGEYLAGDPSCGAADLTPGIEFTTAFGDDWIRFSVLEID